MRALVKRVAINRKRTRTAMRWRVGRKATDVGTNAECDGRFDGAGTVERSVDSDSDVMARRENKEGGALR